jgi:hypothetical protein
LEGEANSVEQLVQTRGVFEHAPLNSPHKIDDALAKPYGMAGGSPSEMAERELILPPCDRSLNEGTKVRVFHGFSGGESEREKTPDSPESRKLPAPWLACLTLSGA